MKVKLKKRNKYKYSRVKSFLHSFKNYKNNQKYHIETIFAQIGAGKSTDIAKQCLKIYRKNQYTHIYANIDTNLPFVKRFNDEDLKSGKFKFLPDSIIFVDECGVIFNNRSYKDFSMDLNKYIRKSRHWKSSFCFYSQDYLVEKTIRSASMCLYLIKKVGWWSIKRKIKKTLDITRPDQNGNTEAAECAVHDALEFEPLFKKGALEITFLPFYSDLFDSFETDDNLPPIPFTSKK